MKKGFPPVALVQTWLFILIDDNPELHYGKRRAAHAIDMIFGSIEIAEIYCEQSQHQQIDDYVA